MRQHIRAYCVLFGLLSAWVQHRRVDGLVPERPKVVALSEQATPAGLAIMHTFGPAGCYASLSCADEEMPVLLSWLACADMLHCVG